MPAFDLSKLSGLGKGLLSQFVPQIVKGYLVEFFRSNKVDIDLLTNWIQNDVSLWSKVGPEDQLKVKQLVSKVGNVSWFTADWLIVNLRQDLPTLCSLFLGWEDAHTWLENQFKEIKDQVLAPTS